MIEINLLAKRKGKQGGALGISFKDINPIGWAFALVLYFNYESFIKMYWKNTEVEASAALKKLRTESKKLTASLKENKRVKEELDSYNKQVEVLKARSEQVDLIIRQKANPSKLLERIARNIPKDMWITSIDIAEKQISLSGNSLSYKSIGSFLSEVNESKFFGGSLAPTATKTIEIQDFGSSFRVESFDIKGRVEKF